MKRHRYRKSWTKRYPSFGIASGLLLLAIAGFLMFLSMSGISEDQRIINKNVTVNGSISRVWTKQTTKTPSKNKTWKKPKTTTNYYADATYSYNGGHYTCKNISFDRKHINVGDSIVLYVDPDAPEKAVAEVEKSRNLTYMISLISLSGAGVILLVTGIISLVKKRNVSI